MIAPARALAELPPYPFAALEGEARRLSGSSRRLLRFALGDPDLPPPPALVEAAARAMRTPDGNRYSSSRGEPELREAFAGWMRRRFGVRVDPEREVCVLLGSKEGLAQLPRAILNPGDVVAVPDPGYPAYGNAVRLAHATLASVPLEPERGWMPRLDRVPSMARLLYLNYPNNPTGAVADLDALRPVVDAARAGRFLIAYDNAYSEITFGARRAPSILELPGARDVALEFHSLSKTLGIPGWRIGFAVGNEDAVRSLVELKSHADSGAPRPFQAAAAELLRGPEWPPSVPASVDEYGARLRLLADGLGELGRPVGAPEGTLYLWERVPDGDGARAAEALLRTAQILVTPGGAFGPGGRGYLRWAVTAPRADLEEALGRLRALAGDSRARR